MLGSVNRKAFVKDEAGAIIGEEWIVLYGPPTESVSKKTNLRIKIPGAHRLGARATGDGSAVMVSVTNLCVFETK